MATPNGLRPVPSNARSREYVVAPGDLRTYAVGDLVSLAGGQYSGPVAGGGAVRSLPLVSRWAGGQVLGAITEVLPRDRGLYVREADGPRSEYVRVRVCDDPVAEFEVVCNNTTSLASTVAGKAFALVPADRADAQSGAYLDVLNSGSPTAVVSEVLDSGPGATVRVFILQRAFGASGAASNADDYTVPWYGPGGSGGPAELYVAPGSIPTASVAAAPPDINRVVFIDPVDGNDANVGTMAAPKKTLMNTGGGALWTGSTTGSAVGDLYLFKRGTAYTHPDTGSAIEILSGRHIGSYGRLDLPRPVLKSAATAVPYIVGMLSGNNCSLSDCDVDARGTLNRSGVHVAGDGTNEAFNRHIRNVKVYGVRQTGSTLRAGVRHVNNAASLASNRSAAYATMYDCDVINVEVTDCGYHGFHATGAIGKLVDGVWRSVRYYGCVADGCNLEYDGHGFSVFAHGVVRDKIEAYTLASGTVYYLTTAQVFGNASGTGGAAGVTTVPDVDMVYQRTINGPDIATYRLRKNTATPTAPGVGEFGFDAGLQRLYLNVGFAMPTSATAGWNLDACTHTTHGVTFDRCLSMNNRWPRATVVQEGHGFAADDLTSDAWVINSESRDNDGLGISFNRGSSNRAINCRLVNNKAGVLGTIGNDSLVSGCIGIGDGLITNGIYGKGLCWASPPLVLGSTANSATVFSGWKLLRYTGADTTAHLVIGHADFRAPTVRLEDSVVDPGVGRVAGSGSGAGDGGFVIARNCVATNDWRFRRPPSLTHF